MNNEIYKKLMAQKVSPGEEPARICLTGEVGQGFHYWTGASGKRYLHTVFSLIDCPEISKANYILVRHGSDGTRAALEFGQTVEVASSLNLAYLRQQGALLGANEIHLHVLAETLSSRNAVETDLSMRHLSPTRDGSELAKAG